MFQNTTNKKNMTGPFKYDKTDYFTKLNILRIQTEKPNKMIDCFFLITSL